MPKPYFTIQYPKVRQFTGDIGRLERDKHRIRGFFEIDVTQSLERIKTIRTPDYKVSFLAWFLKVLADTIISHPPVNGIKKGYDRVIVFKQVDISTIVEKPVDGASVPLPLVIRAAETKSPHQISQEIQNAVEQSLENEKAPSVGTQDNHFLISLGLILPQWLRLFVLRQYILRNPFRMQNTMGTVMVTSLGTVGHVPGFIIPTSIHPLSIGIGTLTRKPVYLKGKCQPRQILHLTVTFDHDVIDGMPARHFIADLVNRLTQGYDLDVDQT
jgi:pyruvate/2-oxoglutarate dehydrogenase complex dihydrolipoamide acyltransferase (E2) component